MNDRNQFATLRKKSGYTQSEVSKSIGVDQSAVAKWESGVSYPKSDKLPMLAQMYDCTIDQLLGYEKAVR